MFKNILKKYCSACSPEYKDSVSPTQFSQKLMGGGIYSTEKGLRAYSDV